MGYRSRRVFSEHRVTRQKLVKVYRDSRKGEEDEKRGEKLVNYRGHVSATDSRRSFLLSGRKIRQTGNLVEGTNECVERSYGVEEESAKPAAIVWRGGKGVRSVKKISDFRVVAGRENRRGTDLFARRGFV